jgi:RecB family exonuclease
VQLRLAVGAARERIHLSYPRIETGESRPRVPSFYVLDVMRAITGSIPRYADLAEQAARAGGASLAWPAPSDPQRALDTFEHDLAVLLPLLKDRHRRSSEGRARYLIQLNEALRRSVTERWARWQRGWHPSDGIIRVTPATEPALAAQRLTARPYSLTALQRFSSCPYQFLLAAMYRLAPLEVPAPLQYMDPLTRGSLFHAIQTEFLRVLQKNGHLPVDAARLTAARGELKWAIAQITDQARDKLAPAIDRVWNDEVEAMTRDLHRWLDQLAEDGRTWVPERFEFAFGLPHDAQRDPASTPEPAKVDGRFLLRGSIDLVERKGRSKIVRVTDHKTGKNRTNLATIVDGGKVLQPVLYGLALESLSSDLVEEGRLSYCTTAGGFSHHAIPLDILTRRRGLEVLEIVDRAIEHGTLAAKPARDACTYCDFTVVCGRDEVRRTSLKPASLLADLDELRKMQ